METHTAVDGYIDAALAARQPALRALRKACVETLTGFTETMAHGMPSYERDGEVEVAFASQKQYLSLYILRTDVVVAHRSQLDHLSVGKACIRYRQPGDVDLDVVRSMLEATVATTRRVC